MVRLAVVKGQFSAAKLFDVRTLARAPLPKSYSDLIGRGIMQVLVTIQGLGAFALITLVVTLKKFGVAKAVIRPLIRQEISRSGVRLLPMFIFLSLALGFLVIGQTVVILQKLGQYNYIGTVMVVVVV